MAGAEPRSATDAALWNELGLLAVDVATRAGHLIVATASDARRSPDTKSSPTDLVTAADRASEQLVVTAILDRRPHDGIEGEEGASHPGTSGVVWHIDPIDGTTNYVYGIPAFAVSVGVEHDGEMVAATVYNPVRGQLYRAVRHQGAWRDDQPIRCSPLTALSTALVATGFAYQAETRRHQAEVLVEVLPRIRDIRRFGSAALDLCATASGEVDCYYEAGLNRWDYAAGLLIAREAGATVANLDGGEPDSGFLVAAPPALFEPLQAVLRAAGATGRS